MKEETRKILEKAQAGDAEAQYLTGLYYEDKGDVNEAFQCITIRRCRDSCMESTPLPYIT